MADNVIKKNPNYECIRALAVITVIFLHTFNSAVIQFGEAYDNSTAYLAIRNLGWWAVPCFLMLTGSLLLKSGKEIPIERLYKKYIPRILLSLLLFGTCFAWMEILFNEKSITIWQLFKALLAVFTGNTWAHLWYLYCLIGLYVLMPMYKLISDHASDGQLKYILFILLIFNSLFKLGAATGIKPGFYDHIETIYPFWLLMGVAFNRGFFKWSRRRCLLILLCSSAMLVGLTVLAAYVSELRLNVLFGYDFIIVVVQSVAMFGYINSLNLGNRIKKIVLEVGEKSYGMYLVHMVFINFTYKFFKFDPIRYGVIGGVLLASVTVVLSYVVALVLYRMPVFKRIL